MYIKGDRLYFLKEEMKPPKKITGHSFATLLGKDNFCSKGDLMAKMILRIPQEPIDPFYTLRGKIAEDIAYNYVKAKCNELDVELIDSEKYKYNGYFDSDLFGGVPDIIATSDNEKCVFEVKSKNYEKYYNRIVGRNEPIECEELQCKYYAYMLKSTKARMVYVFFSDNAEKSIKSRTPLLKSTITTSIKGLDVDLDEVENMLDYALFYRDNCYESMSIPLCDLSDKMIKLLKEKYNLVQEQN